MLAYLIDEQAPAGGQASLDVVAVGPRPTTKGCGRRWPTRPRSTSTARGGSPRADAGP